MRPLINVLNTIVLIVSFLFTANAETITIFDSNATIGPGDSYDTVVVKGDGTVVTMTGGDANTVITMNASHFKMTGGNLNDSSDKLVSHDSSVIEILGGDVRYLFAYGDCEMIISGNSTINNIRCYDRTNLRVSSQDSVISEITMEGSSNLSFLGGTIQFELHQPGTGHIDISGGTINRITIEDEIGSDVSLYISGGQISTLTLYPSCSSSNLLVRISGGSIDTLDGDWFYTEIDNLKIELLGYDLNVVPFGGSFGHGQITGYWHNDVYFSIDLGWHCIYDHVILYDGTMPTDCVTKPDSDLTGDCKVNFSDLGKLSSEWLDCGLDPNDTCWE